VSCRSCINKVTLFVFAEDSFRGVCCPFQFTVAGLIFQLSRGLSVCVFELVVTYALSYHELSLDLMIVVIIGEEYKL
jgi:hypothetical protein